MVSSIGPWIPVKVSALSGRVLITEIKLGGSTDPKEFVEIYNDTGSEVDLSKLTLDYAKPTFSSDACASTDWKANAVPSTLVNTKTLSGTLAAGQFHIIEISMNDNTAGSARLASLPPNPYTTQDGVGWGGDRPCFENSAPAIPANGQSLQRPFDASGNPVVLPPFLPQGFILANTPTPGSISCPVTGCVVDEPPAEIPTYYNIQITELLPDPGSPKVDSLDEYIELYNPYDFAVDLEGYTLFAASQSTTNQKLLTGLIMQPHEYLVLYSATTNLTLVNSSSGQVWLESPEHLRMSETESYPANIGTNKAWALLDGTWQVTTALTPGAQNTASPSTDPVSDEADTPEPCPAGKYRSPETNRCRNITTAASTPTPCPAGQERNLDTNRCRKIVAASSEPAACKEGYERNAETNRCRKIVAVKGASTQTPGNQPKSKLNYILIGSVSAIVLAYAIYEYRKDILTTYLRLKNYSRRGAK